MFIVYLCACRGSVFAISDLMPGIGKKVENMNEKTRMKDVILIYPH